METVDYYGVKQYNVGTVVDRSATIVIVYVYGRRPGRLVQNRYQLCDTTIERFKLRFGTIDRKKRRFAGNQHLCYTLDIPESYKMILSFFFF